VVSQQQPLNFENFCSIYIACFLRDTSHFKKEVEDAFKHFDTDASGTLEKRELYESLRDACPFELNEQLFDKQFDALDTEKTGHVNLQQFTDFLIFGMAQKELIIDAFRDGTATNRLVRYESADAGNLKHGASGAMRGRKSDKNLLWRMPSISGPPTLPSQVTGSIDAEARSRNASFTHSSGAQLPSGRRRASMAVAAMEGITAVSNWTSDSASTIARNLSKVGSFMTLPTLGEVSVEASGSK